MESLQGHFVIASSDLRDPNFFRSVVLIFRHDTDGAAGVIVNRSTNASLKKVWQQVSQVPCLTAQTLRLGGPVQGPLMALHVSLEASEIEVLPGLYFSTDQENLEKLVQDASATARYFVGYAGWGEGQLEREFSEGSWTSAPATAEQVFGETQNLWETLTRQVSNSTLISALKIKHVPPDPRLN